MTYSTLESNCIKMAAEAMMRRSHSTRVPEAPAPGVNQPGDAPPKPSSPAAHRQGGRDGEQLRIEEDTEGFTRSISLYWNWIRLQKAASRVGRGLLQDDAAMMLQCEHWLEAADPKHRYGTNLRPYFDYWLSELRVDSAPAVPSSRIQHRKYDQIPEIAEAVHSTAAAAAAEPAGASAGPGVNGRAHLPGSPPQQVPCMRPELHPESCSSCGVPDRAVEAALACSNGPANPISEAPQPTLMLPPLAVARRSLSAPQLKDMMQASIMPSGAASSDDQPGGAPSSAAEAADRGPLGGEGAEAAASATAAVGSASPAVAVAAAEGCTLQPCPQHSKRPHTDDRFFYWLDEGHGRLVDLGGQGVPRAKLESERVTYLTPEEREQLEVTVYRGTGLLHYIKTGQCVHTGLDLGVETGLAPAATAITTGEPAAAMEAAVAGAGAASGAAEAPTATSGPAEAGHEEHHNNSVGRGPGPVGPSQAAAAGREAEPQRQGVPGSSGGSSEGPSSSSCPGSPRDGSSEAAGCAPGVPLVNGVLHIKEKPCKWIYVLDTQRRLFVHAKYRGKFHHSSFVEGGAVLAAGGIVVDQGSIIKLTADSGHYRPNFESFMATVEMLKDLGADLSQTKLSAKHLKCPQIPEAWVAPETSGLRG